MTASPRVLCVGEALMDRIERDGSAKEYVGGSLLNVARGIAQLGHDTTLASWWGEDERGQQLAKALRVQITPPWPTRTSILRGALPTSSICCGTCRNRLVPTLTITCTPARLRQRWNRVARRCCGW